MGAINQRLKGLRKSAVPPISVERMAEELGFASRQAYHFYESERGFKGELLPLPLARRIASVLADRGVNPDDVLALAGLIDNETGGPELTRLEGQLVSLFRKMTAEQKRLQLQLAGQMIGGASVDAGVELGVGVGAAAGSELTLHDPAPKFRSRSRAHV